MLCRSKDNLCSKTFCGPGINAAIATTVWIVDKLSTNRFRLRTISNSLRLLLGGSGIGPRLPQTHTCTVCSWSIARFRSTNRQISSPVNLLSCLGTFLPPSNGFLLLATVNYFGKAFSEFSSRMHTRNVSGENGRRPGAENRAHEGASSARFSLAPSSPVFGCKKFVFFLDKKPLRARIGVYAGPTKRGLNSPQDGPRLP